MFTDDNVTPIGTGLLRYQTHWFIIATGRVTTSCKHWFIIATGRLIVSCNYCPTFSMMW